jgi:hypothetical protein
VSKTLLKSVPSSLRWLIQPTLFISLGLHLLVLILPLPERSTPESVASDLETQVRVTPLPEGPPKPPTPLPPTPQPSVLASPLASLNSSPTPLRPTVAAAQAPQRPVAQRPVPRPGVPSPDAPSPSSPVPSPAALTTPDATPSPEPVLPPALPFADVPVLTGAETGCYGLGTCRRLSNGVDFRTAGQTLEAQLKGQGYTVRFRDDLEVAGSKTYEITKNGETRYLNVLSADLGNAVYLVTTQPVTLTDLQNSNLPKTELETVLNSLPATSANATQFVQPDVFFVGATPRPETGGNLRFIAGNSPDQVLSTLTGQLQAQGFTLTEAGGYGTGLLYEVTKGALTAYLNLVPTSEHTGTVVVLWSSLPG